MGQHTGETLSPETRQAIIDDIEQGATSRDVAAAHNHSRATVAAVARMPRERTQLTSTGMPDIPVVPWRESTADCLESIVERQTRLYGEALDEGKINPHALPVHMGIFIDKVLVLRSELAATSSHSEPSVADMLGELKGLAGPVTVNIQVNNNA